MMRHRTLTGLDVEEITVERVLAGDIGPDDARIHPETLRHQAGVADADGNSQLGDNLRRAAELAALSDEEVLRIYEALRPGRSTEDELEAIAAELEQRGAAMCSSLVREAWEVYRTRGLFA